MLIKFVTFIVVFTVIVLAHEMGHFLFSRLAGIRILELGMGLGPRIFGVIRNKTKYTLNLFPVGGFVRIAGLDENKEAGDERFSPRESYLKKTPRQKFLSVFGGPLFNLLLAFIIFYFMFAFTGVPKDISNEIAMISPKSEAQRVGLLAGDKILEISGKKISKMTDAVSIIHKSAGQTITLKIDRHGKQFEVNATPQLNKKLKIGLIGFSLKPVYARTNIFTAFIESIKQVFATSIIVMYTVALLIMGKLSLFDLAGPVGIAQFTGQVAGEGIVPLLSFTAFLSINLGIINLLPIPALDGGRIVFILIEAVRKKAIDIKLENRIHQVGLNILLALMAIVTVNDIIRILTR